MRPVTSLDEFRAARARVATDRGRGTIRVLRPTPTDHPGDVMPPRAESTASRCPDWCRAVRVSDEITCLLPGGSRRCGAAQLRAWSA